MQTAFEEYTKKDDTKVKYYDLIMPKGTSTTYWVASRCVNTDSVICNFYVHIVYSGVVSAAYVCGSGASADNNADGSLALFPVISLGSKLIKSGTEGTFAVSLESSSKL